MNRFSLRGLAVAGLLVGATIAEAQPVMQSSPSAPLVPPAFREASLASQFVLPGGVAESESPFRWGSLVLKPHFSERFVYSDGIQATLGHAANSYINSLSAGLLLDIGRHWTLDYSPTWIVYTNRDFKNSLDHSLNLAGGTEIGDWLVSFGQSFRSTNTPRIETGRQTRQEESGTSFNLTHRFNSDWSAQLALFQDLQYIEKSPNYYDWSTEGWLNYKAAPRLEFSVGCRLGYTDFDPGAYMTSSRLQARVQWRATDKVTLSVMTGREHRQFHKSGIPSQVTPTLNALVQYQPFDHTRFAFTVTRGVTPSYFTNSVIEGKGWGADLEQRLLGRITLNAGVSGQMSHYSGSHTVLVPNYSYTDILDDGGNVIGTLTTVTYSPTTVIDLRDDSTHSFHIRLGTPFLRRGTFAVLYERSRNTSNVAGYSFTSHQVGCEVGYKW